MSDIVERLRSEARILARDDGETNIFAMQCGIMREAANVIADLRKELDEARATIANTFGDEEKPRYTTRRMRMELERARDNALEEAAQWHIGEIDRLEAQIKENNEYLERVGKSTVSTANDYCFTMINNHSLSAAAIRRMKEIKP